MQVLKSWLEVILDYLQKNPLEDHAKQLVAAQFVIYCFGTLIDRYQWLDSTFVASLVKMISFHPKLGQKDCPEFEILLNCISPQHRYACYIFNIIIVHVILIYVIFFWVCLPYETQHCNIDFSCSIIDNIKCAWAIYYIERKLPNILDTSATG